MSSPAEVLERLYAQASQNPTTAAVQDPAIVARIDYVCRCLSNRAGVRLLRPDLRRALSDRVYQRTQAPLQLHDGLPYSCAAQHRPPARRWRGDRGPSCPALQRHASSP
jgi:hypothetical protein